MENKKDLVNLLYKLKDHRRKQGLIYPLPVVLILTIMAIMNGSKSERSIARFIENNKKKLIKELNLKSNRVPTRNIIRGVLQKIDFQELEEIFYHWSLNYVKIEDKEWISIDGKVIKGTVTDSQNSKHNFKSLVSVFVSKMKQNLKSKKIEIKKDHEISAVKELIEMLNLQDKTFTLDALHCQKETVKTIKNSKNNYVIGVKGNQKKLFNQIKKTVKPV